MRHSFIYVIGHQLANKKKGGEGEERGGGGRKEERREKGGGGANATQQNYEIYNDMERLGTLQLPLLVGISRKTMIYKLVGGDPTTALNGTTVLNTAALLKGAGILRVHACKKAKESVRLVRQIRPHPGIKLP